MYLQFGSDLIELLKTLGTTSYHIICIVCIMRFNMAFGKILRIFEILGREEFKEFVEDGGQAADREANKKSYLVLLAFMMVGCTSLSTSYGSALLFPSKQFDEGLNASVAKWSKPYSSHSFLNDDHTASFLVDFSYQMYSIVYMSACFICKYFLKQFNS